MLREIAFSIDTYKKVKDRLFVGGRCYEADIRVGDVLTGIARVERPDQNSEEYVYVIEMECELEVVGILTYRRYLKQLSSGMTAELELKENQSCPMKKGKCLYGHSEFELFDEIKILGEGKFHIDTV